MFFVQWDYYQILTFFCMHPRPPAFYCRKRISHPNIDQFIYNLHRACKICGPDHPEHATSWGWVVTAPLLPVMHWEWKKTKSRVALRALIR